MEITTMLRSVYPTAHPLAGEMVPLTVFDLAAFDIFVPTVTAYSAPAPSDEVVKESLLGAVALYPRLAGRLLVDDQGRRFLHVNNEGVLVVEVAVSADLADVLVDGTIIDNVGELCPRPPEENVGAALLQVRLTRYRCGGLVIGVIYHHHVADGHSMSAFTRMWTSAARAGRDFIVPAPPVLERASTTAVVPHGTPTPVFDHGSIEFKGANDSGGISVAVPMAKIRNVTLHFTAEFIADLKARVGFRCSTFQCLLAHVWKKVTAARGLNPEDFTRVRVAVNCRNRANPPASMDFFGNMVLWAFPRLRVRELLSSTYGSVVSTIRDAVLLRIDAEYIQSFVDFGAVADMSGEELTATAAAAGTMMCPDLEVDSWLGFPFHETDLGTGPPCAFLLPDLPIEGLMVFVPSYAAKGGVNLYVAVAEDHVDVFQQICYSLYCLMADARFVFARM